MIKRKPIKIGKDIVSSAISKIPIELHLRTLTGKKYNFCGPNTNLEKRLNSDGTPKEWSEPINAVDSVCMNHDKNYQKADEGIGTRHEADKQMLDELNNLPNKKLSWNEFFAKYLTKGIIGLKYKLGLGIEEAEELHKPIRHKFKRRRVFVFNVDDIWSADLTNSFQSLSNDNKGYKYMLNVIDLFSKTAYSVPLKSKSSENIINAFEKLFKKRKPKKLWTDRGTEFVNNNFKNFLKTNNIELYHVHNEGKACVVERFNRTLGELIQKHLTTTNSSKYVDVLEDIIKLYNNRYHSSIKMTPFEASKPENKEKVFKNIYSNVTIDTKQKFKVDDRVRIYKYKPLFAKGYKPNWTKEIFVISKIKKTNPITYEIKDLNGEDIIGSFYSQELQKSVL